MFIKTKSTACRWWAVRLDCALVSAVPGTWCQDAGDAHRRRRGTLAGHARTMPDGTEHRSRPQRSIREICGTRHRGCAKAGAGHRAAEEPVEFRLVGKKMRRLDSSPKCNGSQKYGLDLDLSGMVMAVVAHPPVFGAKVKSVDDKAARSVEGVREVFEIPLARGATGVGRIGEGRSSFIRRALLAAAT